MGRCLGRIEGGKKMKITAERELETMPFDKMFHVAEGRQELCHATGKEVCFGDTKNPANWWNEYQDSDGEFWYGR